MKMIKTALTVQMAMILMLGCIVPASAAQYVTIADIREETKDGWHDTYTYRGEEIRIDVDIEIPDVTCVPVICVKPAENLKPVYAPENADFRDVDGTGFNYLYEGFSNTILPNVAGGYERYIEVNAQAENSPFNADEALAFATDVIQPYLNQIDAMGLALNYMDAWSRAYKMIDSTSSGDVLDYSIPITKMGYYNINFYQTFFGIPLVAGALPYEEAIKAELDLSRDFPKIAEIYMTLLASEEYYYLSFHPAVVDSLLAEDIPLVSFEVIKNEIISLIQSGYIRDIYRLRLVYVCLYNPDDLRDTRILFPVWEVYGEIMRNPKGATPIYSEAEMEKVRKFGGTSILINAQTGTHYNPKDKSPDRSHAKYITWDEVK